MIRLFSPLLSGGITHPAGTVIMLEPAFERRIVESGNAEYVAAVQSEPFPADMYQPNDTDKQAVSRAMDTILSTTMDTTVETTVDTTMETTVDTTVDTIMETIPSPTPKEKKCDPNQTVFGRGRH